MTRSIVEVLVIGWLACASAASAGELLVHLPGADTQDAEDVAAAAEALAAHISREVPEVELDVRMFRRWEDAFSHLESGEVELVLADAAFLLDRPPGSMIPLAHVAVDGATTRRLLVVVPAEGDEARRLVDLEGATVSLARSAGESLSRWLEMGAFEGQLDPGRWFDLRLVDDELTATANALYGETRGAIVGERNPLLEAHLDTDLRVVYTSPPVPLPSISATGAWTESLRRQVGTAIASFSSSQNGQALLREIGIDGLVSEPTTDETAGSEGPDATPLLVDLAAPTAHPLPRPEPSSLVFGLEIPLPRIPVSSDLIETDPSSP